MPKELMDDFSDMEDLNSMQYKDLLIVSGQRADLNFRSITLNWFHQLQLTNRFKEDSIKYGFRSETSDLEKCLIEAPPKQISKIYKILLQWYTEDESTKEYMIKWAINFNTNIDWDTWEFLWTRLMKISPCVAIRENCFKMMTRWCITPQKLAKMNTSNSDKCWKCKDQQGSFYHMW